MLADAITAAIDAAPANSAHLARISRDVWKAWSSGTLTDSDAEKLARRIHDRRRGMPGYPGGQNNAPATFSVARASLPKRQIPVSPDKKASLERRRRWAASGRLPPSVAQEFTIAEQAVVAVVLVEVKRRGVCGMFIDKIAALAGCSRSTVKRAFRKAASLGLLLVRERRRAGQKSLSNVVMCIMQRVRAWLRLPDKSQLTGKNLQTGIRGGPSLNPTSAPAAT